MIQFELTLVYRDNGKVKSIDRVVGNDLVELLSQFMLVIATLQRKSDYEHRGLTNDDDIPF